MKRFTLTLFAVALLPFTIVSGGIAQQPTIYGSYQDCPFHCRTIRINPNHTFEYRLNGDLYNDERHKGTWTLVGRNKIKATSPKNRTALHVAEKPGKNTDFSVVVIDPNSVALQGAVVSGNANGRHFTVTANGSGAARIPKCRKFDLSFRDYRGNHRVLNSLAREFVVTLTVDQIANWAISDIWLIEGNRLYIAAEDGTFDRSHWLDRLSSEEARKIFR